MSNDDLPAHISEVPAYLSKVADKLAAGSITRDEADEMLEDVLGIAGIWDTFPPDHIPSLRQSWSKNFSSREASRDRARDAGERPYSPEASGNGGAEVPGHSGGPTADEALREQARLALAVSDQRTSNSQDATVRALLESLKADASSSTVDKSKFDFASDSGGGAPSNMHPDAARTIVKVENYCRSIDTSRTALLIQPRKPEFPVYLWNDVLRNQFADLDKVYSHINSSNETTRVSEKIGDTLSLVSTTSRTPTRKIKTFGEWCYAWNQYSRAVVFVFSHRRDELDHWYDFIARIFSTTSDSKHGSVVSMEAAMRRYIFGSPSRCLWDDLSVMHLQHAYLGLHGSESLGKRLGLSESDRPAKKPRSAAGSLMSAGLAEKDTLEIPAAKRRRVDPAHGVASRAANERLKDQAFRRTFVWRDGEESNSPSADSTLHALPFPTVPSHEVENTNAYISINSRPDLFKIVTPFNVDRFEELLKTHPNRPLVDSACRGLREGFWPHADTSSFTPTSPEVVPNHRMGEREREFLALQRDEEMAASRFSPAFESLLPGMQSSALGAVPKPHSDKLRLITDQSLGPHSLNSFIDKNDVRVRYDNLQDLGRSLRAIRAEHGDLIPLVLWKSDIAHAFRCVPMHPLWQIRQVVEIDGLYYVDRCMVFGSRASPVIWCKIAALIAWIAIHVRRLPFLHHYMDDYWSIERGRTLIRYKGYGDLRPHSQVQFLTLLDELGVPHEQKKQVFGEDLSVIGFNVDTRLMTIRMAEEDRDELALALRTFISDEKRAHTLREWQRILGWCNWALNAMPHARPALASSYRKIAGKSWAAASVFMNRSVARDLSWFADRLTSGDGLTLVRGNSWEEKEADVTIYCDACPAGMGFWSPSHDRAFVFSCLEEYGRNSNFCEAATIVSALQWALGLKLPPNPRILIYSDNLAAVEIFSAMKGTDPYHDMTMQVAAWIHDHGVLLRTLHVPGLDNDIADYLSRGMLDRVRALRHSMPISGFEPLPNIYPGSPKM